MASTISAGTTTTTALVYSADTSGVLQLQTNGGTTALTLDTSQNATFAGKVASASSLQLATNGTTTAVTIDTNQNFGLGVTPSTWGSGHKAIQIGSASVTNSSGDFLNLVGNAYYNGTNWIAQLGDTCALYQVNNGGAFVWSQAPVTTAGATATFTERMRLDSSGNLGLGVTPSAWRSINKGLQIGTVSSLVNIDAASNSGLDLSSNVYDNSSGNQIYLASSIAATRYRQQAGSHSWYNAPSGTGTITFTQAMLLDASSNLTIAGSTATKASGTTWANPSDTRLKNNQALYTKGLTELNQIKVKTWVYNGLGGSLNGQTGIGVIADEAMIVLPDTVDTYSAKLNPTDSEETDIKRFNASEVIWLLVTSLQELDAKFESYKATHP